MITGPGPYYAPLAQIDLEKARRNVDAHVMLPLQIARIAPGKVRPGGTLLFISGTSGRRPNADALITALTAALPALARNLALELAPIRVNVIAAGFVDTPPVGDTPRRSVGRTPRAAAKHAAGRTRRTLSEAVNIQS